MSEQEYYLRDSVSERMNIFYKFPYKSIVIGALSLEIIFSACYQINRYLLHMLQINLLSHIFISRIIKQYFDFKLSKSLLYPNPLCNSDDILHLIKPFKVHRMRNVCTL